MTTDTKAAAARLALLSGLASYAADEVKTQRADVQLLMEPGEAHPVRSPLTGEMLARVRCSNPKPVTTVTITDHVALDEWIGREYPERLIVTPSVSTRTDEVLAVLAEHAPHLVEIATVVPEYARAEVVTASKKAGKPAGPSGELDVPGVTVTVETPAPSVSVAEKADNFGALIVDLVTSGVLSADGTLRELPAGDAPLVVDAETDAA